MMSAIHHRKKKPGMYVFGVGTLIPCYQVEEVYAILDKRDENGFNTVYMRPEEKKAWPLMSILMKDNLAFVQICIKDFHQGYISLADFKLDLDYENGKTVFHEGQRPVDVQNLYVISMDTLYEVVNEFFQTGKMPECILWT